MKRFIKKAFNLLGLEIRKTTFSNALKSQEKLINNPNSEITILDIGAYNGSTALQYAEAFPNATIHSFEPFPEAYLELVKNTEDKQNIRSHQLGLSSSVGTTTLYSNSFAPTNSLFKTHLEGENTWGNTNVLKPLGELEINTITLDEFVKQNQIDKIDILKLDVQGAEYMVLEGAHETLKKRKVGIVYTEIITMPTYENQKSIEEIIAIYKSYGFELFNLYNYSRTNWGQLRQIDAIFVNPTIYKMNPK